MSLQIIVRLRTTKEDLSLNFDYSNEALEFNLQNKDNNSASFIRAV